MVCAAFFSLLLYHAFVYYRLYVNDIDYGLWDLDTSTLNDYTIELKITDELWLDYIKYRDSKLDSRASLNENLTIYLKEML